MTKTATATERPEGPPLDHAAHAKSREERIAPAPAPAAEEPKPPLRPLQADAHTINRGDDQHRHFFNVPSREYFDALLTPECDRLLINVAREVHEMDRAEFRIAGVAVIEALFLKLGAALKIIVTNEIDISMQPIEPMTGTGQFRAWYSGDHRRWVLLGPKGNIITTNYTHRQNAEHAASIHNSSSPVNTMSGR